MIRSLVGIFVLVTAFGCLAGSAVAKEKPKGELYTEIVVPDGIKKADDVQKVILKAAISRHWRVVSREDGIVIINLVHRGYDATLSLVYDTKTVEIFSDSYKVSKKGERGRRKDPAGWINNLKKDITVFLVREAYL